MRADQYEDAVRIVTGSGSHSADEFRDGTLGGDWTCPRARLRDLISQLKDELSSLSRCGDEAIREMNLFGLDRAVNNLGDAKIDHLEAAFLAACPRRVAERNRPGNALPVARTEEFGRCERTAGGFAIGSGALSRV